MARRSTLTWGRVRVVFGERHYGFEISSVVKRVRVKDDDEDDDEHEHEHDPEGGADTTPKGSDVGDSEMTDHEGP